MSPMGGPDAATAGGQGKQQGQGQAQGQGAPLFLGIDLSTQSITAVILEAGKIVATDSLSFDQELPKYGTVNGMHVSKHGKVTQPVAMWLEVRAVGRAAKSPRGGHVCMWYGGVCPHPCVTHPHPIPTDPKQGLDKLLRRLNKGLLARVAAVSGSAQQHGSVFWGADGLAALAAMNPADSLTVNLYDGFALADCPIWADSSTQAECDAIEAAVGGPAAVAAVTGSRCYARFTGPQIKKIARTQPLVWQHTARVSLVSSFLTSLLLGTFG